MPISCHRQDCKALLGLCYSKLSDFIVFRPGNGSPSATNVLVVVVVVVVVVLLLLLLLLLLLFLLLLVVVIKSTKVFHFAYDRIVSDFQVKP